MVAFPPVPTYTPLTVVAVAAPRDGVVNVLFDNVCVAVRSTTSSLMEPGNVNVFASVVAASVMELLTESVLALVTVNVPVVVVIVSPLIDVAVATPSTGAVSVGDVSVLFVNVSLPAIVASVPVVGSVTFVAAVEVSVIANAPLVLNAPVVVTSPASVMVRFAPPTAKFIVLSAPIASEVANVRL